MMKHLKQRNIKIVNELMSFFYRNGANKIHIDINSLEDKTEFFLSTEIENLDENTLSTVEKLLNSPRYHEMEEYYWNLTGDNDSASELSLVGMMTDEAEITYKDNLILEIRLVRKV